MTRTLPLAIASAALLTGISSTAHADDGVGFRDLLPGILALELDRWHGRTQYRIDDDDDDGWRTRGAVRGQGWRDDDDDDDGRRGHRGRWQNDDDD